MKDYRIADMIHYFLHHPEELLSVIQKRSCFLHVDELESQAIIQALLTQPENIGKKGEKTNGRESD